MTAVASNCDDLVQQFCAVTGADEVTGLYLLEACGGDLEMAIGMHIDGSGNNQVRTRTPACEVEDPIDNYPDVAGPSTSSANDVDGIRAPIPQKQEVLVEDGFALEGRQSRRRKINSVFDGFRDFQAEARQQALVVNGDPLAAKRRTLEDLFRPPIELLHRGSFRSACEAGKASNRWLLVNVQNVREFACQALNRDVWSHVAVKEVVGEHFLLWQVYSDSEDGSKFMQFYHVSNWPYVAVLDPRTGENVLTLTRLDANSFCEIMSEFLASHPVPDQSFEGSPERKRSRNDSIIDASEDSQLRAAIEASLGSESRSKAPVRGGPGNFVGGPSIDNGIETISSYTDSDSDNDLETFSDEDSQQATLPSESAASKSTVSDKTSTSNSVKKAAECDRHSDFSAEEEPLSRPTECELRTARSSRLRNGESSSSKSHSSLENSRSTEVCWESYVGPSSDPTSSIVFRFPDGVRKTLSLPNSSRLKALMCYVQEQGFPSDSFELVTTYPRRKLTSLDPETTLKDNGLYPQETIFVQEL